MKRFSRILTLLLTLVMMLGIANPVSAEGDYKYTAVAGGSTKFSKYLITNDGQAIPDITFEYEIEPGKAVPAIYYVAATSTEEGAIQITAANKTIYLKQDGTQFNEGDFVKREVATNKFEVFAGIGTPTISNAVFGETDPKHHEKYKTIQTGDSLASLPEGKVYSKDTVTVTFTGISFDEPGIYRYIITEKEVNDPTIESIEYDIEAGNSMKRVLDVYVVDDPANPGKLKIEQYLLHKTETEINLTAEQGSKDANAEEVTVSSKWIITDGSTDTFDTKEEAEAELARRRSLPTSTPSSSVNYDEEILAQQAVIDAAKANWDQKKAALEAARTANNIQTLETDLANAQAALNKLNAGDQPEGTIDQHLGVDPFTNTEQEALKKFGRDALIAALVTETDPKDITNLRTVIAALDTEIATATQAVEDAQAALDAANQNIATAVAEEAAAKAAYDAEVAKMDELVRRHNGAAVAEVAEKIWKLSDKSDSYVNSISTYDLQFGKEVEGNQGSKDKYFKYTVTITGLRGNSEYFRPVESGETPDTTADGTNAYKDKNGTVIASGTGVIRVVVPASVVQIDQNKSTYTKEPTKSSATKYDAETMKTANNVTQLTADSTGKIEHDFYLQDGDYIHLADIPSGVTYTIVEDAEDYKKTDGTKKVAIAEHYREATAAEIQAGTGVETANGSDMFKDINGSIIDVDTKVIKVAEKLHDDATTGTLNSNVYTGFTNTRNGIIPTGVLVAASSGAAILGIGIVGMLLTRKKDEDEDEE